MKLKRLLACLLAFTASVSMFGCMNMGGNNNNNNNNSVESSTQSSESSMDSSAPETSDSSSSSDSSSDNLDENGIPQASNPTEDFQAHYVEGMLHEVNVDFNSPASLNFIKDGQSEYKLITGTGAYTNASQGIAYANKHFGLSTNCMLERDEEANIEVSQNSKYILYGCTESFKKAGFTMPTFEKIGTTGYYVVTYGSNVFIQAYGAQGYQLATLFLLRQTIGFDMISTTTCVYEKDGTVLPQMEALERPDFDFRQPDNAKILPDVTYGMGFTSTGIFLNTGTSWMHNIVDFLGGDARDGKNDGTVELHRGWFSDDAGMSQGCFTARGDQEEYKLMVENYVEKTIGFMKLRPEMENIVIGQMDVVGGDRVARCGCNACDAAYEYYGDTNAGAHLTLVNDINRGVQAWLDSEENQQCIEEGLWDENKTMNLLVLVYGQSIRPPIQTKEGGGYLYDEEGKGVAKPQMRFVLQEDGSVVAEEVFDEEGNTVYLEADENVDFFYCASSANYLHSFYEDENVSYASMVKGWEGLKGNFYVWTYEVCYYLYMYPYNSYDSMLENLRYFKNVGANHLYYQGLYENENNTCFDKLRTYIISKGLFDTNVDYEEILDRFFKYQFDEGGDIMREYFNQVVQHLRANELYTGGSVHSYDLAKQRNWPEGLIRKWYNMINEAFALVEYKKTADPERYEELWINFKAESLFPRYVLCTTYANSSSFSTEALKAMRKEFMNDFTKLGNTSHQEHTTIADVFSTWDV